MQVQIFSKREVISCFFQHRALDINKDKLLKDSLAFPKKKLEYA